MKQMTGRSPSGDVLEATRDFDKDPSLLLMYTGEDTFEDAVRSLHTLYPDVPFIAAPAHYYDVSDSDKGVEVCALYGAKVITGVMRSVSTVPSRDIVSFKKNVADIGAGKDNTICIDMCTGNDACVLSTISDVLMQHGIHLSGGTVKPGCPVAVNGTVYTDSCVYALIRNLSGRAKVYKENIYRPLGEHRFIASSTDRSRYYIGELNGRPAKIVYEDICRINDDTVSERTFRNPFGKMIGKDIFIVSVSGISGDGLTCYRQVNDSDVLTLLELKDYKAIVRQTIDIIRTDFPRIAGIISVNCILRQQLFENDGYKAEYLKEMSFAPHIGFFSYGEHYENQFINQTMSCAVFE